MRKESDADLVQACLAGDRKAFEMLVARYEKKLFNTSYRVVNDYEDAMDATQTTFVKAYEKLDTFNPSYRFFSWIYRILLNESLNLIHQRKRFDQLDSDIILRARNPEENLNEREAGRHIQAALMDMKPDYRVLIVLKHFQELSYDEISEVTGIPTKTVKSRLFTARQQLRELLLKRGVVR